MIILIIILIIFIIPTNAYSINKHHPKVVFSDPITEAVKRAEQYWKNVPCHNSIPIISSAPVTPQASMWTYIVATPAEEMSIKECPIYISNQLWPNWITDDTNFEEFCKGIAHEFGHLEGYPDEGAKPGTIQFEVSKFAIDKPCEHFRLIYGKHIFEPTK